jgi:anti-sigma B factor antagonist
MLAVSKVQAPQTAPRLRCHVLPERTKVRVAPEGELDLATVGGVRAELDHLLGVGFTHIVLDLRRLSFLDSTGLRLILETKRDAEAKAIRLEIVPGPPEVQRIFEITKTDAWLFG